MTHRNARWLVGAIAALTVTPLTISAALGPDTPGDLFSVLISLSFLAVGSVVALRQPSNLEGWLLTLTGPAWALTLTTPFDGSWVVPVCLMTVHLPLRFPDGSLPSPRWRAFSWFAVGLTVVLPVTITTSSQVTSDNTLNDYYVAWTEPLAALLALLPFAMAISVASVVARYRRTDSIERHQVRWIAWAGCFIVALYSITLIASIGYDSLAGHHESGGAWFVSSVWWLSVLQFLALASFLLIPVTFAIAILRYRLYDIDRLISRTVSYSVVSASLVLVYGVVVWLLGQLLPDLDSLGLAAATLAAAAAFRPILTRVQSRVDRRFNRARFDAQRVTHGFSTEMRHAVDAQTVVEQLSKGVQTTLEPSVLAVWVRPPTAGT